MKSAADDRKMLKLAWPDRRGMPTPYDWQKIWNPEWFQGNRRKAPYFEGWYFKHVSADGSQIWSFIPGIALDALNPHAFIQVINGRSGQTWYFRYPLEAFAYSGEGFAVSLGGNHFSAREITLDLQKPDIQIRGRIRFVNTTSFPASLARPGIMGWYRYMPFMECYHGVVSLDHTLQGQLWVNEEEVSFANGKGYIEKDWGVSMPKAWIWMQSNHFAEEETSLMLSVARIPWIGYTFTGFLGFFLLKGQRYDFATYTGARIRRVELQDGLLKMVIRTRKFTLELAAQTFRKGPLKAPVMGQMERIIHESIDSELSIRLVNAHGELLYEGFARHCGLELVGDLQLLHP